MMAMMDRLAGDVLSEGGDLKPRDLPAEPEEPKEAPIIEHENVRGASYYH